MKKLLFLLILGLAAGGGWYYTRHLRAEAPPKFRTAQVERGDLLITFSASGTVQAEELVDVGAQVVGRIQELGTDPRAATDPAFKDKRIDYGSPVEQDTVLAKIDPTLYLATFNEATAGLARAKADLLQLRARLEQTTAEWHRAQKLRELKLTSISGLGGASDRNGKQTTIKGISDADFVLAKANYEVAKANVDVGASVVAQQEAGLLSAKTNLEYTIIKSPVQGTIIDRRVNVGQTVVASLNAPSLFLIAKDLRRMEVWPQVNEADIGQVTVGMPVSFTVDAYRDRAFRGTVKQIRLNANFTNNVVTYTVVVTTSNDDLKLLPYLSADVDFEVEKRSNVLQVPNAALRYRPRPELVIAPPPGAPQTLTGETTDEPVAAGSEADDWRTAWVRKGNFVYPVEVQIGVTDGLFTEIVGGDLKEDMELVLNEVVADVVDDGGQNNPFAFRRPGGKKKDKDKQDGK